MSRSSADDHNHDIIPDPICKQDVKLLKDEFEIEHLKIDMMDLKKKKMEEMEIRLEGSLTSKMELAVIEMQ